MLPTDYSLPTNEDTPANVNKNDIFSPKSIAVIGASRNPEKIGYQVLANIINGNYEGLIFPVNPKADNILNIRTYKHIKDISDQVELAIIIVPAPVVPDIVQECADIKVRTVVIISAGFKETGPDGEALEQQITNIAHKHNMKIIGPNCLGFINTDINLNATFSATDAKPGNIVLFSQSGAFGTAILDWANQVNIGFKYFVSIGNKAVVDENFLLDMWTQKHRDTNENLIFAGYLEDIKKGQEFMEIASNLSQKHPVIILKPGKSEQASKAISSHTGSMATQDVIVNAALKQSGCIRVSGIEEMFDTIQILSRQSIPRGNRVAIITNAGGPAVTATDMIDESPLEMAELSESTKLSLKEKLPPASSVQNPIDVMGDALADRYQTAIETTLLDENVDSILTLLTPQAITEVEKTASMISQKYRKYPFKPIITSFIGGETTAKGITVLNQHQMPIFRYPGDAIRALSNAFKYTRTLNLPRYKIPKPDVESDARRIAQKIITSAKDPNIVGDNSEYLAQSYGIRVPPSVFLDPSEPVPANVSVQIGFPVAVKISSPLLLHKTEFSAVKLGVKSQKSLGHAVTDLNSAWKSNFGNNTNYQIQIQKMITGENLIIGFKQHPSFGPIILFGLGGIFTEVFNDTSQRIAPVSTTTAVEMIYETKASQILTGFRGKDPSDIDSIVETIEMVSQIAIDNPEIAEFDINPFIVLNDGHGGYAVDVKIILQSADPKKECPNDE